MDRREVEQEMESLDADGRRVAELLGGLKRVEAPSNFEFGVRARIANGAPERRSSLVPVLKLAAPLVLIMVVATIVVFYQRVPDVNTASVDVPRPIPASSEAPPMIGRIEASNNSDPVSGPRVPDEASEASSTPQVPRVIKRTDRRPSRRANSIRPTGDASRDDALRPANTINPPGIRWGNQNNANSNIGNGPEVPVSEVLEILGVSADPMDSGWKVNSTKEGSIARKSGVQSGDIIEAIDGREITRSTTFKGPSGGKTIRVRRGGKSLDLKLTN